MRLPGGDITAVLDENLAGVLDRLGLASSVAKGTLRCSICHQPVTIETIGAIFQEDGRPHVVCDRDNCLLSFVLEEEEEE